MNDVFPLSRDHPVPEASPTRYPWADMEVGDSFFVPNKRSANMASTASSAGQRLGRVFVVRTVREGGENGVRIWRRE